MTEKKAPYTTNDQSKSSSTTDQVSPKRSELIVSGYGSRGEVKEMADRLTSMLPGVKKAGPMNALALAQVAVRMGLNPFVGEIWLIPSQGGTFSIMTGIKGLRRAARSQAAADDGFYTVSFRLPHEDELTGMKIKQGDIIRACDLYLSGEGAKRFHAFTGVVPMFIGIGIYRSGEATRMEPLQVARKRAEADALKQAFDLPLAGDFEQPKTTHDWDDALPAEPPQSGRKTLFKTVEPKPAPDQEQAETDNGQLSFDEAAQEVYVE